MATVTELLLFFVVFESSASLLVHPETTASPNNALIMDDIIDLRHRLVALETIVTQMQQTMQQKDAKLLALEKMVADFNMKLNGTRVAFSAYLDVTMDGLNQGQSIAFNRVLTDVGSDYSTTSGHFTAPQSGTYFFTWHTQTSAGHTLTTCLAVNGLCKVHAYANAASEHGSDIQPDGNSCVITLAAGDVAWILVESGSTIYSNSVQHWFYPTFTGYKL